MDSATWALTDDEASTLYEFPAQPVVGAPWYDDSGNLWQYGIVEYGWWTRVEKAE